jgi:pyruvate,water dikinase
MDDLDKLRHKIETQYFPDMDEEFHKMQSVDPSKLSDSNLAEEIQNRYDTYKKWEKIYWDEFIPLAHGIRLFGKIYNEKINPKDPFEYVKLLKGTNLLSVQRNQVLEELSEYLRQNQDLLIKIQKKQYSDPKIQKMIEKIENQMFKHSSLLFSREDALQMINLVVEFAEFDRFPVPVEEVIDENLENIFFTSFSQEEQDYATKLLDFGRACYRLRDDDNIYLGKIEKSLNIALHNAQNRLEERQIKFADRMEIANILLALRDKSFKPPVPDFHTRLKKKFELKVRQIVGQPSSSGTVRGKAHVIKTKKDLFSFKKNDILVVDSVEPNMTFVIPLAKGIVEQRGGYLVHGAIIAREYKIPCVTGVPNAINSIETGDEIVVDGDFGLVIVDKNPIN